ECAKEGIAAWPQLPMVGHMQLAPARVEASVERRDRLDGAVRPDPSPFTSPGRRGADGGEEPIQHPAMPQSRVGSEVAAVSDQPVSVSNILDPQQIRLAHAASPI